MPIKPVKPIKSYQIHYFTIKNIYRNNTKYQILDSYHPAPEVYIYYSFKTKVSHFSCLVPPHIHHFVPRPTFFSRSGPRPLSWKSHYGPIPISDTTSSSFHPPLGPGYTMLTVRNFDIRKVHWV